VAPIANYQEFLQALCSREWDIGICPLTSTDFNRAKSNNKWVEYTSAGIAVIASADTVYDQCCSDGCGYLCGSLDEWRLALERLVTDASERVAMVGRAQKRLETDYGIDAHREQILDVLRLAKERTVEEPIKEHA
jgi:glycosyltransferase involved in cell wall biosynthesis